MSDLPTLQSLIRKKNKLHPDIINFWRAIGSIHLSGTMIGLWICKPRNGDWVAVALEHDPDPIDYYFQGESYSEQEMLRIIKMKAFI